MEPVGHIRIIFGNPCVFIVETPKGNVIGSAISQMAHGGSGFVTHLANQLLRAVLELSEVQTQENPLTRDPAIEPPEYFRGIGDRPV